MNSRPLAEGIPAPWFTCGTGSSKAFAFDTAAGRYIVLCFFGSAADPRAALLLEKIAAMRERFNDRDLCFFGVSTDPDDERQGRIADSLPGIRHFRDFDGSVSRLYGALSAEGSRHPLTYVIDPGLRILATLPFAADPAAYASSLLTLLDSLPAPGPACLAAAQAPVLVVPRVFEPQFCRQLMEYYQLQGGQESGFMRDIGGRTSLVSDPRHKRRRDCKIEDDALRDACMQRIHARLVPEIRKAYQFHATRVERHIVACYDAQENGHFRRHRDNTTKGTAHRQFAVSLFLNSGDYEGGHLRFPEFGNALYSAPQGGAIVFSCSLLHEATPVRRGRRYMYLPFLYDENGRKIRETNLRYLEGYQEMAAGMPGAPAPSPAQTTPREPGLHPVPR